MARDDETGAIAAATYFLTELYPYTEMSQDTTHWVAMSHPDCIFCKSVLADIAAQRDANRVAVIAPIRVQDRTLAILGPAMFSVKFEIRTGPDEDFSATGVSLGRTTADGGTANVIVVRQGTIWRTRGVDLTRHP